MHDVWVLEMAVSPTPHNGSLCSDIDILTKNVTEDNMPALLGLTDLWLVRMLHPVVNGCGCCSRGFTRIRQINPWPRGASFHW